MKYWVKTESVCACVCVCEIVCLVVKWEQNFGNGPFFLYHNLNYAYWAQVFVIFKSYVWNIFDFILLKENITEKLL